METLERSREIEICHLGARSRAKCVLWEQGACGITLIPSSVGVSMHAISITQIMKSPPLRGDINFFCRKIIIEGSRTEKRGEQGKLTKIKKEQRARTPLERLRNDYFPGLQYVEKCHVCSIAFQLCKLLEK